MVPRMHGGDLKSEDPYLDKDYAECRRNFVDGKHETWPIPQNQGTGGFVVTESAERNKRIDRTVKTGIHTGI